MVGGKEISPKIIAYWEELLANEGMPAELPDEDLGFRVNLGDGLGGKTDQEEYIEDNEAGHSRMCPIRLGSGINSRVDQPNDRPVEEGK